MMSKTFSVLLLLVFSLIICPTNGFRRIPRLLSLPGRALSSRGGSSLARTADARERFILDKYVTKLFNDADTNKDGGISPAEVYELVLKFYIFVNQQAPIPPPSRERVMRLFKLADKDRGGRLDLQEFRRLLRTIYARASSRILVFKLVSMLVAPISAISLVEMIQGVPYLVDLFGALLPESTPKFLVNLLEKDSFWVTIFTVLFIQSLGKLALRLVDWFWWGSNSKDKYYEDCDELEEK
ncbi:expressed unknown protein [Seminavis robusta]|uniref:EF-hand domain-containing protein n=1 Tax=Seminavis robusta TaxID=568900 RepID=A0A9N8E159_9STRA|nr:expressed unknown protein [Seminavis robusta]|eukprot:Sro456_g146670.1 n/a (240) ;mRNA; f:34432-35151